MRSGFFRPLRLPLPFGLFPCLSSDFGTQLTAVPFNPRRLAPQWLPRRLDLSAAPLSFRLRFWLLGFGTHPFQMHPIRFELVVRERTCI